MIEHFVKPEIDKALKAQREEIIEKLRRIQMIADAEMEEKSDLELQDLLTNLTKKQL